MEDLEKEWDSLYKSYCIAVQSTSGCGSRGQIYIDKAYKSLLDFSNQHTDFKASMPKKINCSDDAFSGLSSGF